jgi:hypothetical protein
MFIHLLVVRVRLCDLDGVRPPRSAADSPAKPADYWIRRRRQNNQKMDFHPFKLGIDPLFWIGARLDCNTILHLVPLQHLGT